MRIKRVPNQRQLIATSFSTKNKGPQSQMMNNSTTKWLTGNAIDNLKLFLVSSIHNKPAQVMQKATKCTQNAACTTSRETTSNSAIAVTARTTFNDQEMHLLRLSWVRSWRIEGLLSVFLESCWVEELMSLVCVCGVGQSEGFQNVLIRSRTSSQEENWGPKWKKALPIRLELVSSLQLAPFECFMHVLHAADNAVCSVPYPKKRFKLTKWTFEILRVISELGLG